MNENPYKAPEAPVVSDEIPAGYLDDVDFRRKLYVGGLLSVVFCVFTSILLVNSYLVILLDEGAYRFIRLASDVILIYVLLVLRQFLKRRFAFVGIDWPVITLILLTLLGSAVLIEVMINTGESLSWIAQNILIIYIPMGIALVALGFKIRKITVEFPYLATFANFNMAFGACIAIIILSDFAFLFGPVWDFLLAMVFFSAVREFARTDQLK